MNNEFHMWQTVEVYLKVLPSESSLGVEKRTLFEMYQFPLFVNLFIFLIFKTSEVEYKEIQDI